MNGMGIRWILSEEIEAAPPAEADLGAPNAITCAVRTTTRVDDWGAQPLSLSRRWKRTLACSLSLGEMIILFEMDLFSVLSMHPPG